MIPAPFLEACVAPLPFISREQAEATFLVRCKVWTRSALVNLGILSPPVSAATGKKRLVKSPLDSIVLLLPFLIWAALILIIYPVSYSIVANLRTPVAMVNSAQFVSNT